MFKIDNLIEYNKIASKYDEHFILLKNNNLLFGLEVQGMNYYSSQAEVENQKLTQRVIFLNKLKNVEVNIFCEKKIVEIQKNDNEDKKEYVKELINKLENIKTFYSLKYYIFITPIKKNFSYLEKRKIEKTQEIQTESNIDIQYQILNKLSQSIKETLKDYSIKNLTSNQILNFNANYCNMQDCSFIKHNALNEDYFLINNIEFKKNYIIHHKNNIDSNSDNKKVYSRFLSIKNYDTAILFSNFITQINKINCEFLICSFLSKLEQRESIKEIHNKSILKTNQQTEENLFLIEQIKNEEESLFKFSYSILLKHENLETLDFYTNEIINICEKNEIVPVIESINLQALYISYLFGNNSYNVRQRLQTSSLISTMINFENDNLGFKKNSWGKEPLAILKHVSGLPYLFNLHKNEEKDSLAHSLVIGTAGSGKTMLMQIFMLLAHKFDINIFALDKLNGMFLMTNYIAGDYNDLDSSFKLNPLSLEKSDENIVFLKDFFKKAMNIDSKDNDNINDLNESLERLYRSEVDTVSTIKQLYSMLNDDNKQRLQNLLNSFLDNEEDSLEFKNKLTILNMDSILKNQELSSLVSYYIFHKIKYSAKKSGKGFLLWIDELKDYLYNKDLAKNILESILESRKINGAVAIGVQNIDFFDLVDNKDSFLDNIANFIIFPTSDTSSLEKLEKLLNLTTIELDFLSKTPTEERKFLIIKKRATQSGDSRESSIIDFNLKNNLKEYLDIFSSSSSLVKTAKECIKNNSNSWRKDFLKTMKEAAHE